MALSDRENLTRHIRDAVDLVDLVGGHVTLRRAGANYKGLCPFHEDKTPSFTIWPSTQTFKCFGCGAGGDVFTFVQLRERVDFLESRRMLAERAGISLDSEEGGRHEGPGKRDLARANGWAQKVYRRNYLGSDGERVRRYVADRGISEETAEAFGLGLAVDSFDSLIRQAGQSKVDLGLLASAGLIKERQGGGHYDTFRHRLMFPIRDTSDRIVGFGGRALGDDPAKYLNTPATLLFEKSRHLFGMDLARAGIAEAGRAVVVEGYTDCLMAHQFGFTETVATLGTAMTDEHARLLRRHVDRVVLVFDSDEAGQRAADRGLSVSLMGGLDVSLARVPEGKDPCDYLLSAGQNGFSSVLKQGIGALEFKWQQVSGAFEASKSVPGRRRAIEEYLQQLAGWISRGAIDQIQTGLLLNQVSKILSLPTEDLHRQLKEMVRRTGSRSRVGGDGEAPGPAASGGGRRFGAEQGYGAQQEALRQVVEVLLNEPGWYSAVREVFDPSAIADEAVGSVARGLVEMLEADASEFRLDALIGRMESPAFGRLITDLQLAGARRGGYEALIEGAVGCLEAHVRFREAAARGEEIRSGRHREEEETVEAVVPSGEDERLATVRAGALTPHAIPLRARKRFLQ